MTVSSYIIPCVIAFFLCCGLIRGVPVFECFLEGAREGLSVSVQLLPTLIGLMTCVGMFKASGALDVLSDFLAPLADLAGVPQEILPLALLRPVSGSGSLVLFEDLLKTHGADSLIGRTASVLQGSTETTFYTIAVYFSAANITRTHYTLFCALAADAAGLLLCGACVRLFFPG